MAFCLRLNYNHRVSFNFCEGKKDKEFLKTRSGPKNLLQRFRDSGEDFLVKWISDWLSGPRYLKLIDIPPLEYSIDLVLQN